MHQIEKKCEASGDQCQMEPNMFPAALESRVALPSSQLSIIPLIPNQGHGAPGGQVTWPELHSQFHINHSHIYIFIYLTLAYGNFQIHSKLEECNEPQNITHLQYLLIHDQSCFMYITPTQIHCQGDVWKSNLFLNDQGTKSQGVTLAFFVRKAQSPVIFLHGFFCPYHFIFPTKPPSNFFSKIYRGTSLVVL